MAIATLLTIWAAILAAGDTPIGRLLRGAFVVRPAALLDRIRRGHVTLVLLLLVIGAAASWAGGGDALRVLGLATPDVLVWATTFEVATYLDLAVTIALAASMLRLKSFLAILPHRIGGVRKSGRRHRVTRQRMPDNDDGEDRSRAAA